MATFLMKIPYEGTIQEEEFEITEPFDYAERFDAARQHARKLLNEKYPGVHLNDVRIFQEFWLNPPYMASYSH